MEKQNPEYIVIHSTTESNILFAEMNYNVEPTKIIVLKKYSEPTRHCSVTGTYIHPKCRNSNSVGVQLYAHTNEYISETVENRAAELVANLMIICDIPIENVLRHYDVTHKHCPELYVSKPERWSNFKDLVLDYYDQLSE